MAYILCIETATTSCSISISEDTRELISKEISTGTFNHSELLHTFIEQAMHDTDLNFKDLDCIAVSKGPGSYTGLRIGVSSAKGLAFALDIPMVGIPTLDIMAKQAITITDGKYDIYVPMLDARRMEVYTGAFDKNLRVLEEVNAKIIDNKSFLAMPKDKKICFFGDGMNKCRDILPNSNTYLLDGLFPHSKDMIELAYNDFIMQKFVDTAYFEPFYLKDFVGGAKTH